MWNFILVLCSAMGSLCLCFSWVVKYEIYLSKKKVKKIYIYICKIYLSKKKKEVKYEILELEEKKGVKKIGEGLGLH